MKSKKKQPSIRDQRRMRLQSVVFAVFAVILILSWIASMVSQY
jgi:hypothetical protein